MTPHEPALQAPEGGEKMDLIARLEAATGPDHQLADDLLLACGWTREAPTMPEHWQWSTPDGKRVYHWGDAPDPLQSVDVALLLIPKGWRPGLETPANATSLLYGWRLYEPMHRSIVCGTHKCIAIALCIACLKALHAQLTAPTRGAAQAPVSHV